MGRLLREKDDGGFIIENILTTILRRPYVFAFLIAYLILAWRIWSAKRIALWLLSGYAIAWLSELSSIHTGFPYGEYHYIYDNLKGELLIAGVPFFDSLSYTFLIFAGFATAEHVLKDNFEPWFKAFVGALLTTLLDVIIDPIATMGDKWFLGKIHFYARPGFYFGVPLTNFAGWFLVSFTVISFNMLIWRLFPGYLDARPFDCDQGRRTTLRLRSGQARDPSTVLRAGARRDVLYPLFYLSIALFNIAVTFWAGQWRLGVASVIIFFLLTSFLWTFRSCLASRTARTH